MHIIAYVCIHCITFAYIDTPYARGMQTSVYFCIKFMQKLYAMNAKILHTFAYICIGFAYVCIKFKWFIRVCKECKRYANICNCCNLYYILHTQKLRFNVMQKTGTLSFASLKITYPFRGPLSKNDLKIHRGGVGRLSWGG